MKWLFQQKVSAAREFAHLDYDTAKADFLARRAAGQPVGSIVQAWRVAPPRPGARDVEPAPYTPEWFAQITQDPIYRRGDDLEGIDLADDDLAVGQEEDAA